MANYWTAPKTDWDDGYGVGYEDFNRIEANVKANRDANTNQITGFGFYTDLNGTYDGVMVIEPGECYSSDGFPIAMGSQHLKNLNTWAAGNGAQYGGMASAVTVAAHTWYYTFIIMNPTDGSTEIMFDDNIAGINISSGTYTKKRYVGAFKTHVAGSNGSFNLCEMYSYDGANVFINHNYMFTSRNALEFSNSAGANDTFVSSALSDQVNSEGFALPARPVLASMIMANGSFTTSLDIGLFSAQYSAFTIPTVVTSGSYVNGELAWGITDTIPPQTIAIMVDISRRIQIGLSNAAENGSVIFRVKGYYDERLQ